MFKLILSLICRERERDNITRSLIKILLTKNSQNPKTLYIPIYLPILCASFSPSFKHLTWSQNLADKFFIRSKNEKCS